LLNGLLECGGANPYITGLTGTPYRYIQTQRQRNLLKPAHPKIEQILITWMKKPEIQQAYEGICAIEQEDYDFDSGLSDKE